MDFGRLSKLAWHAERVLLKEKGLDNNIGWEKLPVCPFKGRCYETTVAIYEMMDDTGLSLYRKKDIYDEWHWFIVIDQDLEDRQNKGYEGDFIIDVTGRQYRPPLLPPTHKVRFGKRGSELEGCELMKKPLHYPSYKDKVEKFKKSILEHMDNWEKRHRNIRIVDFMEDDTPKKPETDTEKPITLDDFFS